MSGQEGRRTEGAELAAEELEAKLGRLREFAEEFEGNVIEEGDFSARHARAEFDGTVT